jgi:O-antigen/teichoic acid export membrane protein
MPVDSDPGEDTRTAPVLHTLVASSVVYALASAAAPLVSLVLAPFLTHSLSRRDFGALAVITTAIALVAGTTQFGLGSAFFRAYNYDYESRRDRLGVFATVVELLLLSTVPVSIAVILLAPEVASLLLGSSAFTSAVRVAAVVVLAQNLTVPGYAWLRAENRAALFSVLTIASLLLTLGATILLVGVMHAGITGTLIALAGGYGVVAIATLPYMLSRSGFPVRRDIASNVLSFGLPLVVSATGFWILSASDRYLLSLLSSLSETATYSVAYSLGTILNVAVIMPFMLAWPAAMFSVARGEHAPRTFTLVFRWFSLFLLLATFAFSPSATLLLLAFFPSAYHSAAPIIPVIATSLMFYGISIIFGVGVGIKRKNWYSTVLMLVAAVVNVGLNLVLIPSFGSMGAAVSTLIAYALLATGAYVVNQAIYPVPFEVGLFGVALVIGIALYVTVSLSARSLGLYGAAFAYAAALGLFGVVLVVLARLAGSFPAGGRRLASGDGAV